MIYYNSITTADNLTLSCDMLRLKFFLNYRTFKQINNFIELLSLKDSKYNYTIVESRKQFGYKYLVNFKYENSSFVLGLGYNGVSKLDSYNCFIEFNPNKCLSNGYVQPFIDFIKHYANGVELVRFDFAIDIPCKRSLCSLTKDRRKYNKMYGVEQCSVDINNLTEYLGRRNKNGFVKLYNKTYESKLDYNLTRLEITLDSFDYENFKKHIPVVYFAKDLTITDYANLKDTDKVLLTLLLENDNANMYIKMLGRVKQQKFRNILNSMNKFVSITESMFYQLIYNIRSIYNN